MGHALRTEITIDATPEEVWDVLTDFHAYRDWNPFIIEARGAVAVGERLELRMEAAGGRSMTIRPTVTRAAPGHVLEWLGSLGVRGLFDGRHRFELETVAGGTRLTHGEDFRGLLVPAARRSLDATTLPAFDTMNAALAARVAARRAAV